MLSYMRINHNNNRAIYNVGEQDMAKIKKQNRKRGTIMYTPTPANTKDIILDKDLLELTEKIAENVHDVWAAGRIADGWTYGEQRDDAQKKHPCLVPYDQLSESEKEYDRNTAFETIKLIVALGYKIEK